MTAAATLASPRISPQASKPRLLGDDDRAAFVAARDQREEQVRGLALERQVAGLVDDQQPGALETLEFVSEVVAVLGGFQARDPLLHGRERDAMAGLAGLIASAIAGASCRCRAGRSGRRWRARG